MNQVSDELKEQIRDLLACHIGITFEQFKMSGVAMDFGDRWPLVREMIQTQSDSEIRRILADMIEEDLIYQQVERPSEAIIYRARIIEPDWVERVDRLISVEVGEIHECLGHTHTFYSPEDFNLVIAPMSYEIEGEKGLFYDHVVFDDIEEIIALFDLPPKIGYGDFKGTNISLDLEGQIDGEVAWITFQCVPYDDLSYGIFNGEQFTFYKVPKKLPKTRRKKR